MTLPVLAWFRRATGIGYRAPKSAWPEKERDLATATTEMQRATRRFREELSKVERMLKR